MQLVETVVVVLAAITLGQCVAWAQEASSVPAPAPASAPAAAGGDLWELAKGRQDVHRFSTLIPANDVRKYLSSDEGIRDAIGWCRKTGVTKVYIETFRGNYQAERATLEKAKAAFLAAGFQVSGCVTTTKVGKPSTGWKEISCFTDPATQDKLQAVFEFAASLFDEIMIDDFWFTDCACPQCEAARKAQTAVVGAKTYPTPGPEWEDYRCELMVALSRDRILAPAKRVNPKARLIIKYPQWYDDFHRRGYEIVRESADFDRIWVGTETRDYTDKQWGGTPQYEAYFIMRWLGGLGGAKCGGGWYDPYGTTERTYVEQARQTVLGGARESLLFCYGSLLNATGPKNVEALRACIPELLSVAAEVGKRQIVGVAAYKPPSSHPGKEPRVFDFVGMMGLPLAPCHQFPADAPAGFFSIHALKDADLPAKLAAFIAAGKPTLITDALAEALKGKLDLQPANVRILPVKGDPKGLLTLPQSELDAIRTMMLKPLKATLAAPNKVAFYLFGDGSWVVENFNDDPVKAEVNGATKTVPARGWVLHFQDPTASKK
jgi:hypothetical protein